jgi:hypothetical protein
LVWSADEKYLAYIAEKNADKVGGFFDLEKKDDVIPGNKFKLQEDWGETYKGGNPAIFACSLDDGVVCCIDGIPENLSAGQVQFSPSGEDLIFVGWNNEPRRLGIVHCYNRPSAIFSVPFDRSIFAKSKETKEKKNESEEKKAVETNEKKQDRTKRLTTAHRSSRSPRFSPDGKQLVYLASDNAVTHNSASKLCSMEWQSKTEKVVVDIPSDDYAMKDSDEKFPGLYTNFLGTSCFLSDSVVALETMWRSRQTLVTVDTAAGRVTKVKIPSEGTTNRQIHVLLPFLTHNFMLLVGGDGSILLLDVRVQEQDAVGAVLLDASSPNKPNNVLFGKHNLGGFEWTALPQSEQFYELSTKLGSEIGWSVGTIPVRDYIFIPYVQVVRTENEPCHSYRLRNSFTSSLLPSLLQPMDQFLLSYSLMVDHTVQPQCPLRSPPPFSPRWDTPSSLSTIAAALDSARNSSTLCWAMLVTTILRTVSTP